MRTRRKIWLLALLALTGCRREVRHLVEGVDVASATVAGSGSLALSPDRVRELLLEKLAAQGNFVLLERGQRPPSDRVPVRLTLEISSTREARREGWVGTFAEVGATLVLRRRAGAVAAYYEVTGLGEVKIPAAGPDERREAARHALAMALQDAVSSAHLQLLALDKKDAALLEELSSGDSRVRDFAVRVLADRRNPAVVPALLDRLAAPEPDEVRRAIGGLVELRDPRAVPALIDLARGKAPFFVRELLFALSAIGGEEAEAYLYTVAAGHDLPEIREAAQQALEELQGRASLGGQPPGDSTAQNIGTGEDE